MNFLSTYQNCTDPDLFVNHLIYQQSNIPYTRPMNKENSQQRILQLIKINGPQTAVELSVILHMTSMGARSHLERMEAGNLVTSKEIKKGVGRPKKIWCLTEQGQAEFPDGHDQLTQNIIVSVRELFGEKGLDELIEHRSIESEKLYASELSMSGTIEEKLIALVRLRTEEGYMATYSQLETGFIFIENHCPICAAAKTCQGFCRSELDIFKSLFNGHAEVERSEHILEGARRCAYKITPH